MYDITSNEPKDPEGLQVFEKEHERHYSGLKLRYENYVKVREASDEAKDFERKSRRVAQDRYSEDVYRGYNILTCQNHVVEEKMKCLSPLPKPKTAPQQIAQHHREPEKLSEFSYITSNNILTIPNPMTKSLSLTASL